MPDANKEATLNALTGAAFGAAGQRCMALSTAVFVGEAKNWVPEIIERAQKLKVNAGMSVCSHVIYIYNIYVWIYMCLCVPAYSISCNNVYKLFN